MSTNTLETNSNPFALAGILHLAAVTGTTKPLGEPWDFLAKVRQLCAAGDFNASVSAVSWSDDQREEQNKAGL
jgi:hypothetical protein